MKALRLKLFQETACYKKPLAFKVSETYPLPPHSTVKGMLHAVLDAKEFIPMNISVQGQYDTIIQDYQTHYFMKKSNTPEFPLTLDGLAVEREYSDITTMPIYTHMLLNVELLIHVVAEEDVLQKLKLSFDQLDTHLSLGRREDLVRVDHVELVDIRKVSAQDLVRDSKIGQLKLEAFIPKRYLLKGMGYAPYRLNWKYTIKKGVRIWEKIEVGYIERGRRLSSKRSPLYVDDKNDLVLLPFEVS